MVVWVALLIALAGTAVAELLWLNRQRRLFLGDAQRRRFFVQYMQRTARQPRRPQPPTGPVSARFPSVAAPPPHPTVTGGNGTLPVLRPRDGDEGVAYVDAEGRCAFANQTARDLLHWRTGELALGDVLTGGTAECTAVLAALEEHGTLTPRTPCLTGSPPTPVEISAVALRDRDDNFWGAAIFIRRVVSTTDLPAAPSRH